MDAMTSEVTEEGEDKNGKQMKTKYLTNLSHKFSCGNVYFQLENTFLTKIHYLLSPGWCWPEKMYHFSVK